MSSSLFRDAPLGKLEGPAACDRQGCAIPLGLLRSVSPEVGNFFVFGSNAGFDAFQNAWSVEPGWLGGDDIGVTGLPSISFSIRKLLLQFGKQCGLQGLWIRIQKSLPTGSGAIFGSHPLFH